MSLPTLAQTSALLRHRRSIKPADYDPQRPVETGLVAELLENATWAPSHGLTEPWKFHVFTGAARTRLADCLQALYRQTTPAAEFREDKLQKMGDNPRLAPVVVACVLERGGNAKIPEIEEVEALACAVQNLMLSATAAGLACFWSSPPVLETAAFGAWLGQGTADRCLGLIYLGWPKPGLAWPRSARQPAAAKTLWHHD